MYLTCVIHVLTWNDCIEISNSYANTCKTQVLLCIEDSQTYMP